MFITSDLKRIKEELRENGYEYFDSNDEIPILRNKWAIGNLWFCDAHTAFAHLQDQRELKRLRALVEE